jgi:hypothetical protein
VPSWVADVAANTPWNAPIGVRRAAAMTMDSVMVRDPGYALYWLGPRVAGVYAAFFLQRKKNPR